MEIADVAVKEVGVGVTAAAAAKRAQQSRHSGLLRTWSPESRGISAVMPVKTEPRR